MNKSDVDPLDSYWGHFSQILILHGLGIVMGYSVHFCLVKWLGSKGYGMLSYANSVTALFGIIVAIGFPVAAVRFVPEFQASNKYPELKGFLSFGGWSILFLSLLVGILSCIVNLNYSLFPGADKEVMSLSLILALPVSSLVGWQYEVCRGRQKILAISWFQHLISPAILLLIAWSMFRLQGRLLALDVLLVMVMISFFVWFGLGIWQSKLLPSQFKNIKAVFPVSDWLRVSSPLYLSGIFLVVMAQVDILLVGSLLGPLPAGVYGLSSKISGLMCIFLTAANVLAAPLYAHMYAQKKHLEIQKFASRLAHFIFWPSLCVAVLLIVFGSNMLKWFGPEFSEGYLVIIFLVIGHLVNAGSGSVGCLADLTGLHGEAAIIRGFCAGLNVVLSWFFITLWGLAGAALATALCLTLWNLLLHRLVSSRRNINPSIWASLFKSCHR